MLWFLGYWVLMGLLPRGGPESARDLGIPILRH